MRKISKVQIFIDTGKAKCVHHGEHREWSLNLRKPKIRKTKKKGDVIDTFRTVQCKKCIRERTKRYSVNNPWIQDYYRFGFDGTAIRIVQQAKARAKKKKLPFTVTADWVKERLIFQQNRCLYSNMIFDFSMPKKKKERRPYVPSLDQKIIGLGYTEINTAIVCSIVNTMKFDMQFNDFVNICGKIRDFNK